MNFGRLIDFKWVRKLNKVNLANFFQWYNDFSLAGWSRAMVDECYARCDWSLPMIFQCFLYFVQHGAVLKMFARLFRIKKVSSPRKNFSRSCLEVRKTDDLEMFSDFESTLTRNSDFYLSAERLNARNRVSYKTLVVSTLRTFQVTSI